MRSRSAAGVRAALLLEVIVALAILVAALGLLSAQLASGLELMALSEDQVRAAQLADYVLALVDLDPRLRQLLQESDELEYAFTDETALGYPLGHYPGYFWRITTEPAERERQDLELMTIEILRQRDRERAGSIDGAAVVRRLALLRAAPARIDLVEDAGMAEELVEQLRQQIPIPDFDPRAVDLQQIIALSPEVMQTLLPTLMAMLAQGGTGGGGFRLPGGADEGGAGLEELEQLEELRPPAAGPAVRPPPPPPPAGPRPGRPAGGPRIEPGRGSGPGGRYTLEDLMRLRDEWRRQQEGGG